MSHYGFLFPYISSDFCFIFVKVSNGIWWCLSLWLVSFIIKNVHLGFIKKEILFYPHLEPPPIARQMQPDLSQVIRGHAFDSLSCPHLALVQVYSLPGISLQGDTTQRLTLHLQRRATSSIRLLTRSMHPPCTAHTVTPDSGGNWEPEMGRWVLT